MTDHDSSLLDEVHVVLLRPKWARNLGAVARAMKNFGLRRLTLVDSHIGSWNDAWQMAVHSHDVLESAVKSNDLAATLAPATWVVGTTNEAPPGARMMTPTQVAEEARHRGPPTLLFGGEIHGLDPAEMLRCNVMSTIPTAPEQSSLNLGQAVCVYAAALFAANLLAPPEPQKPAAMAGTEMVQRLEGMLTTLLDKSSWTHASRRKNAIAQLMQPLYRAQLTELEVHAWLIALHKIIQT